jgi:GAF domain-containing protein
MYDQSLFMRTLSQFSAALLNPYDVDSALTDLMERLTGVLGLSGSGVALAHDGHLELTTALPEPLMQLERVQIKHQSGPCVEAYRTSTVVAIADLGEEHARWPEYCATAEKLQLSSVAGIPMRLSGTSFGALNLYADGPRPWPREDIEAAVVMADMATNYLINSSKIRQQELLSEQLQHALDSKSIIEQAKGIVASENSISIDEAFNRLRSQARREKVTVRSLAEAIVQRGMKL